MGEIKTPRRLTRSSFTFARFKAFHTHTHTHITMASMTFAKKMALPSRTVRPAFAVSRSSRVVVRAAPETINGRLAMLGFIAALGAEASSGETIFQQVGDAEPSILFAFIMFAAASLIPIFKGVKKEKFAFFSPEAEMLNGRAAMIGFALLLAIEAQSGSAFF